MAGFCKQHCMIVFGEDTKDFAELCEEGYMVDVLCEGCGEMVYVDHEGNKLVWSQDDTEWVVDDDVI